MSDDWRLRIEMGKQEAARRLGALLASPELEHDLDSAFEDRVVVSIDDAEVFCYAGTSDQAQGAERLIRRLAREHGWAPEIELTHWHPISAQWEAPDASFADDPQQAVAEHEREVAAERAESARRGYPEYEVRIRCGSRRDARELSERLEREAIPNVHRHNWVLVGATDEDSAQALAARLRTEAADATAVTVERNARAIYDDRPWSPFAVLGGLGG